MGKKKSNVKLSWDQKLQIRKEKKELTGKLKDFKEQNDQKLRQQRINQKIQEHQKQLNQFKSSEFQIIKDSTKIKKWNKKARQKLARLPPEMFDKIMHK